MRRPLLLILLCFSFAVALPAKAASGRVIKVLPQFIDLQGRTSLSPSLYDRDAYQAFLRQHTNQISGVRFNIQWKVSGPRTQPMVLRLEVRGTAKGNLPSKSVLETAIKPSGWFGKWTELPITGEDYKRFGEVTAWRASVWEGDHLLGEQTSFLW